MCTGGRCGGDGRTSRHSGRVGDPADRDPETSRKQERGEEDDESQQHLPRPQNAGQS